HELKPFGQLLHVPPVCPSAEEGMLLEAATAAELVGAVVKNPPELDVAVVLSRESKQVGVSILEVGAAGGAALGQVVHPDGPLPPRPRVAPDHIEHVKVDEYLKAEYLVIADSHVANRPSGVVQVSFDVWQAKNRHAGHFEEHVFALEQP